ncbi:MAG: ABC transporter permease [Propionibacteriales bacterium]|nr:ABC transporter permease [Propionibacteriales bacterium]
MSVDVRDPSAVPLEPMVNPGRVGGLLDVFRRRYLLKLLVRKELRVRYQGSVVGFAWSYVKPAVRFLMYYFIIELILGERSLENRPLHIFAGMIMVTFITNALSAGTKSVVKNKSLVRKISLPREMFPVASIMVSVYHLVPMYVIIFLGCLLTGWHPDLGALLAGVMALAVVLTWGLAVALLLSALNVFFRDMGNIIDVVQTVITWTVPMIYPFSIIADRFRDTHQVVYELYLSSPLCIAVLLNDRAFWVPSLEQRQVGLREELPEYLYQRGVVMIVLGLVFVWIAQAVFARLESRFAEKL